MGFRSSLLLGATSRRSLVMSCHVVVAVRVPKPERSRKSSLLYYTMHRILHAALGELERSYEALCDIPTQIRYTPFCSFKCHTCRRCTFPTAMRMPCGDVIPSTQRTSWRSQTLSTPNLRPPPAPILTPSFLSARRTVPQRHPPSVLRALMHFSLDARYRQRQHFLDPAGGVR